MIAPAPASRPTTGRRLTVPGLGLRRALYALLVLGATLAGSVAMLGIVAAGGLTVLEVAILLLFVPTFGWITTSFWNAVIGFALGMMRRDPITLRRTTGGSRASSDGGASLPALSGAGGDTTTPGPPSSHEEPLRTRTALVMPAHNEQPRLVVSGLRAIIESLESTGQAQHFDVHLLSDTTDPSLAREEAAAWRRLRDASPRPHRLHYRRRAENVGRKAGNIAEFCDRCSDEYDFVIVLDADSVMRGTTLVELVRLMEANPDAGIIQTVPIPARQNTRFGRFVQFAAALYSPMLAAGQSFWQGDAANYWGHNAILRLAPFAGHARLPVLRGRPPLGGPVLSHDFVEAALVRRAGWGVFLVTTLEGSWEGLPGNVIDFANRDRRWAQGSLQHLRLLGLPGLHPVSRLHFLLGATGYLSSPLWLLLLLTGTGYVLVPGLSAGPVLRLPVAGTSFGGLFAAGGGVVPLLAATAVVLFAPKLLGLVLALRRRRRAFGGAIRLIVGALTETVFSVVAAPMMMLFHTRFVLEIVSGHDVAWSAQPRDGRAVRWSEAVAATLWMSGATAVWAAATLALSPLFFLWLVPIFAGSLLAAPLVRWTSLVHRPGMRRMRLLDTPSDTLETTELGTPDRRPDRLLEGAGTHAPASPAAGAPEVGRDAKPSHMFLAKPDPKARLAIGDMYEAERGLFDLQRGRPVLVTPSGSGSAERPVLVAAVEGLGPETLNRLHDRGCGPIRLVVTAHRAAAMGIAEDPGTTIGGAFSVGLRRETNEEVLRLATSPQVNGEARQDARRATVPERAGVTLMRLARMLPATVAVETDLASVPRLAEEVASGAVLTVSIDQVADLAGTGDHRVDVTYVSDAPVPLEEAENVRFMLFREANALTEHVAILIGERERWPEPVPVRLHSACLTGDLFGSLRCDCGEQLRRSLRLFNEAGGGVLLYLEQEGRGIGLGNKLRAYSLQQEGLDTVDADCTLGFGADERRYHGAVGILRHLGIDRVRLLTNNPEKLRALEEGGIEVVDRTPLHGTLNRHNLPYVRAKVQKAGHWLGEMLAGGTGGD